MQRKAIVAVFGGHEIDSRTEKEARRLGEAIVSEGAILLTGGQPIPGTQVKLAAMRGAVDAEEKLGVTARVIGVLSKGEPAKWKIAEDRKCRQLLIQTNLTKGARDLINGLTSDVVFVLQGGSGTLAELGFAIFANKPICFIGSVKSLNNTLVDESKLEDLRRLLKQGLDKYPTINTQLVTTEDILGKVGELLKHASDKYDPSQSAQGADRARDTVKAAIASLNVPLGASDFPGVPDVLGAPKFDSWLQKMP